VTYGVLAAGAGLALAFVYEWRKTLLAPIFLHVLENTAAVLVALAAATGPFLGTYLEPVDGGCRVTRVLPGTPAEAAGLREGDLITTVDGWSVTSSRDVTAALRRRRVGDMIAVEYVRDGQTMWVQVILRPRE